MCTVRFVKFWAVCPRLTRTLESSLPFSLSGHSRDTLGPAEAARPSSNRQPGCGAGQNKPRGLMKCSDRWRGESPGSTLLIDRSLTKFMTNDVMRLICVPRHSLPAPIKAITQLVSSPHHGPTYTLAAVTRRASSDECSMNSCLHCIMVARSGKQNDVGHCSLQSKSWEFLLAPHNTGFFIRFIF